MQHVQIPKIYSIQTISPGSELIEIETVILNGLYKFSILGINQKNSSDIKDRVYSALRSQKVLNLKSDNKKITVNLLPTTVEKKSNVYDLGIALGCMIHTGQIKISEDVIAIGELSITGSAIPSSYILKTIYLAILHNIKTIICSVGDLNVLNVWHGNIYEIIENNSIKFIAGHTLGEIVSNIKNEKYYHIAPANKADSALLTSPKFAISDINIFKIILAICTKRNVFIENKKDLYLKKFLKNLMYYSSSLSGNNILYLSSILPVGDIELLKKHEHPVVSFIDSQTQKETLHTALSESVFGFNIIEDFASVPEEIFYTVKKLHASSILCFYNPCPCGNINNLFTSFGDEKCLCLQRNILRYRQRLQKHENGFFDFYINNISENKADFTAADYIEINNILHIFKNTPDFLVSIEEREAIGKLYGDIYDRHEIDMIIAVAKDIIKLQDILYKTKSTLSSDSMDFAIELIKKGF